MNCDDLRVLADWQTGTDGSSQVENILRYLLTYLRDRPDEPDWTISSSFLISFSISFDDNNNN